jgi:Flp pilus assembly protein TadG
MIIERHWDRALKVRKGRRAKGQALVEFALIIPIFLLIVIALFDLGRAVFSYNTLTNAAREGARLAIVNQDIASIISRAENASAIVELNVPNVTVDFYQVAADGSPDTSSVCSPVAVGCLAVVTFQATYQPITPIISNILFGSGVTFTAKAVLPVEYSCPNTTFTAAQCPRQP